MNDKKKPAHELRVGKIKAVIWANGTEGGERFNAVFKRIYRIAEEKREKGDNGWRETDSIGRDDLLLLAKVADMAHSWMNEQNSSTEGKATE